MEGLHVILSIHKHLILAEAIISLVECGVYVLKFHMVSFDMMYPHSFLYKACIHLVSPIFYLFHSKIEGQGRVFHMS